MIALLFIVGWLSIGSYVIWVAVAEGHIVMEPGEGLSWLFGAVAWPWVLVTVRKEVKHKARLRPFEDWAEKYDQEQIDKRLDDLADD